MRKLGRLLLLAGLTALAGLILVACGGGSSSSGGTSGGTATVLMGTAPDYLDPQEEYTTQGAEANWISYTPLVTYKHENAPGRQRAHSGSRDRAAADLVRSEDLHPHPAQGPRVLERPARQGQRLQVHGRAHDQGQLGRQELRHRQRRGRDRLRRGQGERHLGHHDRRCDRQDHDPARRSRTARSRTCWRSPSWVWFRAGPRITRSRRIRCLRASGRT